MKIRVKLENSKYCYDDQDNDYDTEFHGWDLVIDFLKKDLESFEEEFESITIEVVK
jgi:hypothetical protein